LYEGFGFPPLEAMKCGCPVVASNATSLPEVIGDAGVFVNPYSENEIFNALHHVITDKKLHEELVRKGKVRIQQFTWERTVEGILKVMMDI
jgi:glycosyltransferase involved in cell wall biosynthesis